MRKLTQRQRADKARRLPPEEDPEFQIAPMIDILLVLLVFFMSISSKEELQSNHAIPLPVAADGRDASKNSPGQVIINLSWLPAANTGSIEISDETFEHADQIIPAVQSAVQANPLVRVLIRSDRNARWSFMKTILKAVSQAGVANVTFSVLNKETVSAPPAG